MKRVRFRFTKAKWNTKAFASIVNTIAEEFPDAEMLIVRAGQTLPILDLNVYLEDVDQEKLKEIEKKIFSILTDFDISHVVFKGAKVFEVGTSGSEGNE